MTGEQPIIAIAVRRPQAFQRLVGNIGATGPYPPLARCQIVHSIATYAGSAGAPARVPDHLAATGQRGRAPARLAPRNHDYRKSQGPPEANATSSQRAPHPLLPDRRDRPGRRRAARQRAAREHTSDPAGRCWMHRAPRHGQSHHAAHTGPLVPPPPRSPPKTANSGANLSRPRSIISCSSKTNEHPRVLARKRAVQRLAQFQLAPEPGTIRPRV